MMIRNSMELTISCADEDVCEIMKRSQEAFVAELERCDFDKDYIPIDVLQQPYYVEEPHPDYPDRALNLPFARKMQGNKALNLPFMRQRQGNLLRFLQYKDSSLADPITGLAYGPFDPNLDNDSSPYAWILYFVLYRELFEGGNDGRLGFYYGRSSYHWFQWALLGEEKPQYRGDALTSAQCSFEKWSETNPSIYSKSLEDFLGSYFSLGNYMICPRDCNLTRAGSGATTDTVDHYLFHMWKHFSCDTKEPNGNSETLHGLFKGTDRGGPKDGSNSFIEMLKKCRLDGQQGIESFDDFVERFYFQDFCEYMSCSESNHYTPINLSTGKSFAKNEPVFDPYEFCITKEASNEERRKNLEERLDRVTECTQKRNIRVLKKLKEFYVDNMHRINFVTCAK